MRMHLLAVAALAACAGSKAPAPPPAAPAPPVAATPPAPEPPGLRLPRAVVPTSAKVRVNVDPRMETFSGRVELAVRVAEPTKLFWLHAENLTIGAASASAGGKTYPLQVVTVEPQPYVVGFRAAEPLPAGDATVTVEYTGKQDDKNTDGLFRQKEGDDWYAFTQFEAVHARRAFPCLDEPDVKIPWQVSLEVPENLLAASNTRIASETPTGKGSKLVAFAQTRPLPSYLVAFAVGPFDVVDGAPSRNGTALRVLVPRGRSADAAYALESTPPLLALLEDYFGTPYPYDKLDLVAVPITAGFGAMENPGLITYGSGYLLAKPHDQTLGFMRRLAYFTAHEVAHQWFGDLVTLAWWDDIWLNESFAEWMADKIVGQWKPDWHVDESVVQARNAIMGQDALQTAKPLRRKVESQDDLEEFVDYLAYKKGTAVLRMFERWVGAERFQDGVRAYLKKHAWGNASAGDFFAVIGEAAGQDIVAPMATFIEQAGAPLVTFALECDGAAAPRLRLSQERYLPKGSQGDRAVTWQLPVCVKLGGGARPASRCTLLAAASMDWKLEGVPRCPTWVLPNEGGSGYYRSALQGDLMGKLLEVLDGVTPAERLTVIGDVLALTATGKVDIGEALSFVPRYAASDDHHVVNAVAGIAEQTRNDVPPDLLPNYTRFVQKTLGARARRLGWKPAPGEDEDRRLLRKTLVPLVAEAGEDRKLAAEAKTLALAWLEDHDAVDPEMSASVLAVAAYHGDAALFDRYLAAAKAASDRKDRQTILGAMSSFRDPRAVEKALQLVTSGEFDPRESIRTFFGALQNPGTRPRVYAAVKANYDVLVAKLPKPTTPYLVFAGVAQCDAKLKSDVEGFFKERTPKEPGGAAVYAQAMEAMDLCIRRREAQRPGVARFLRRY